MTYFRSDHFNEGGSIELARQYGRYGYRKIAALLRQAGWSVSDGRIERIWKREGLGVPAKQPKRGRLWLTDGSCIRLRPERANHVWSYDFVEDRTHDGRRFRMLNVIDEFTHECLAIHINRKLKARSMSLMFCPTSSSCGASPAISDPTMDQSLSPKPCRSGSPRLVPRPPTSNPAVRGRTATSRALMPAFATNCSTARSSTPCAKRRSSSKAGGATTTRSDRTHRFATNLQRRRSSCQPSPRGRLRYVDRLRRPRWPHHQLSTNIRPGPLNEGCSSIPKPANSLPSGGQGSAHSRSEGRSLGHRRDQTFHRKAGHHWTIG